MAYEQRISDWSSDVCSSDLPGARKVSFGVGVHLWAAGALKSTSTGISGISPRSLARRTMLCWSIRFCASRRPLMVFGSHIIETRSTLRPFLIGVNSTQKGQSLRSEEHTSELQSLMRISYAVFCLKQTEEAAYNHSKKCRHTN